MDIPNLIGLFGVALILVWYFFLQTGRSTANDLGFSVANAVGAFCLLISLMYEWNLPTVVIEVIWLMISIYGIAKAISGKKETEGHRANY